MPSPTNYRRDEFPRPIISWREPKAATRKRFQHGVFLTWYLPMGLLVGIPAAVLFPKLRHYGLTLFGKILFASIAASYCLGPLIMWYKRGAPVVLTDRSIQYGAGVDGHESYYSDLAECAVTQNNFAGEQFFTLQFKGKPHRWLNVPKIEVPEKLLPRVLELLQEKKINTLHPDRA
jgi:hypothetical protein